MENEFSRLAKLIGPAALDRLRSSRVLIFGIGGVGGHATLALARAGIGSFTLTDSDTVEPSNINRQAVAFRSTIGRAKVDVMKDFIADINPDAEVESVKMFYLPETADLFDFTKYDYIIDCVDTVTAKLDIIERAKSADIPVISAMGAGNKLGTEPFRVSDITETSICPLAKVMRRELKKRGITDVKVCWSPEKPVSFAVPEGAGDAAGNSAAPDCDPRTPGSISYVPSVCGLVMAGEVIRDLAGL